MSQICLRLVSESDELFLGHSSWNLINLELATMNKQTIILVGETVEWLLFNFSHHHFIEMVKSRFLSITIKQSIQKIKLIEEVFYHKKATHEICVHENSFILARCRLFYDFLLPLSKYYFFSSIVPLYLFKLLLKNE